jgi:hypothetical protein
MVTSTPTDISDEQDIADRTWGTAARPDRSQGQVKAVQNDDDDYYVCVTRLTTRTDDELKGSGSEASRGTCGTCLSLNTEPMGDCTRRASHGRGCISGDPSATRQRLILLDLTATLSHRKYSHRSHYAHHSITITPAPQRVLPENAKGGSEQCATISLPQSSTTPQQTCTNLYRPSAPSGTLQPQE